MVCVVRARRNVEEYRVGLCPRLGGNRRQMANNGGQKRVVETLYRLTRELVFGMHCV